VSFQHHETEFQHRVPLVVHPFVVLHAFVVKSGSFPAVFVAYGQSQQFQLLGETGALMAPIHLGAQFGIVQQPVVKIKLGLHQVDIAAFQQRPVNQALVLRGKAAPAPGPVVGRIGSFGVNVFGVEGEQAAVKLGGVFAKGVAAQLVAEHLVISSHLPGLGGGCRVAFVDADVTAVPVGLPPILSGLARFFIVLGRFGNGGGQAGFPHI